MPASVSLSVRLWVVVGLVWCLPLFHFSTADVFSSELYGQGDEDVLALYQGWSDAYRAARDDITLVYDVAVAESALVAIQEAKNDFINLDAPVDLSDPDSIREYGFMFQVPIAAQGLAWTYNLASTINASVDPPLVLDLKALADIFMGNITKWSDPYISSLNPQLADAGKLPAINITLAFIAGDGLDLSEPLKRTLTNYNAALGPALNAANGSFSGLPPALAGNAVAIADQQDRLAFVQANEGAMTYLGAADAWRNNNVLASLVNKAGFTIAPTTQSVDAAVADYAADFIAGDVLINIGDAPGNDSYPLAYISYLSLPKNITVADCSTLNELLTFFSWTQINQRALDVLTGLRYNSFGDGGRKQVLGTLSSVLCNGQQAFDVSILIGVGAPLAEFAIWPGDFASTDASDRPYYYFASTENAKKEASLDQVDFAVTTIGFNSTDQAAFPGLTVVPAAAIMVVPAYNLPVLNLDPSLPTLVLNLSVIAEIYLGTVERWSDPKIDELNPGLSGVLPDEDIVVLVLSEPSEITELFSSALNLAHPDWSSAVGVGGLLSFPVEAQANRTVYVTTVGLVPALKTTPNSFAFWTPLQVLYSRTADIAHLAKSDGSVVAASQAAVTAAIDQGFQFSSTAPYAPILMAPGAGSWPIVAWASFLLRSDQDDCVKLRGLVDYMFWIQTGDTALEDLSNTYGLSASSIQDVREHIYKKLEQLTCQDQFVAPFQYCLINGTLCSNAGQCSQELGTCVCQSGRTGVRCENETSSSTDALAIGLGVGLPVGAFLVLLLVLVAIVALVMSRRRERDNWEIDLDDEIELGTVLGTGGFGEVYRATWKGTEVAVKKVMSSSARPTKEMEKSFRDEVRVMTALRHPNVVLFMAACTKAPNMCIVMEYMALGSLYELLHNELVPEIPQELNYKMAYQAAKGMHFLHSSGIVHRDLKSLNLLLDSKWNVKVSDFGLTKFKEDLKTGGAQQQIQGSIHWTAPEILNEVDTVDYILSDIYSFGIVLWELLTREQPYHGMSPAAVAVAVIRDNLRPTMPEDAGQSEFAELITTCWHQDPSIRPTFLEVMTRLSAMLGDSSGQGTRTSKSSSSASSKGIDHWSSSFRTSSASSSSSGGSSHSSQKHPNADAAGGGGGAQRPPKGDDVTIVFTDIARAASLWEFNPSAMRDATLLHNNLLRSLLKAHGGYEAAFIRDRNSGEGSFCMAFHNVRDALAWCSAAQQQLLLLDWPASLLDHPGAAEEWGNTDDRVIYKGLRVRMGINVGSARAVKDAMSRRVEYVGPTVNAAARITALTHGGQVLLSQSTFDKFQAQRTTTNSDGDDAQQQAHTSGSNGVVDKSHSKFTCLGRFEVPDCPNGEKLYEFRVEGLEARFFGGVGTQALQHREVTDDGDDDSEREEKHLRRVDRQSGEEGEDEDQERGLHSSLGDIGTRRGRNSGADGLQNMVGEGMMFKEDNFLTSANLCRWIIDFKEIQLGKQVGMGSYGIVYRGRWKGVDVAVKRFIKQKLDERSMLEFRAEMAFLSELHHPNIVLFIGSCVKAPNLCIVTEFVKQGSLSDLLANTNVKLEWLRKMRMLRSAALGINYLHSLRPVIVHRDLKSSNLLVDETWNVKVADFGFARIKENNATMTRCGTPCWTAPEVIRGEKYSEKADVYSFGVITWEVLTRKQPFAGLNFMGVSLDVLEGKRPQVPNDCPADLAKLIARCWHNKPDKRPTMEDVVAFFDRFSPDDAPVAP